MLEASGLKVVQSGVFVSFFIASKSHGRPQGKDERTPTFCRFVPVARRSFGYGVIQAGLSGDNWMTRTLGTLGLSLPGLSWWALCQK